MTEPAADDSTDAAVAVARTANPAGEPLMAAKFRVQRGPADAVVRQRLLDRLTEGVRGPLTVVAAPPGAGKTTLVGSWASAGLSPGALTWITLDEGDERPGVFWSYVLEGLTRSGVPLSTVTQPDQPQTVDQSFLICLSADLYARREPVVLVLDDADVLLGTAVLGQIDFLLRHSGPHLKIVLLSRRYPALTLQRHRLAGSLTEILGDDLAFTEAEAKALLHAQGVDLAGPTLAALVARTRGWAAGLALTAMSLRTVPDPETAVASLAGDRGNLADYFLAEVLDRQPPKVRRFMLRTSIVTHVSAGLAAELTGRSDAGRVLAILARANSFLEECSRHDDCYRYHPLFAELLRGQLGFELPATVGQLHRKAAAWFAEAGSLTDAVRQAAHAGDWAAAAGYVVADHAVLRMLAGPDGRCLATLLGGIPDSARGAAPAVIRAALAIGRGDVDSCASHLTRARDLVRKPAPQERAGQEYQEALAIAIALIEVVLAGARADVDGTLAGAAAADALLDEREARGIEALPGARALVLLSTGSVLLAAGHTDNAAATLARAVRAAHGTACEHVRVAGLGRFALAEVVRGRLTHAVELASASNALADRCGMPLEQRPASADAALAWAHAEACETSSARLHVDRAAATTAMRTDPVSAVLVSLVRSRLLRAAGDVEGALTAVRRVVEQAGHRPLPSWLQERITAAAAAIHIAAGRPAAAMQSMKDETGSGGPEITVELARAQLALGHIAQAGATATELLERAGVPVDARVNGWLLQAACALERGGTAQALTALDHALRLAEPERMCRPVLEAPPPLRAFIRHHSELAERHPWLGAPVNGPSRRRPAPIRLPAPDPAAAPVIVEPLTEKEQEVLRHLAALLSTEEIARTMFVSVNTVKTHVRGILRKLAASRRNEAIRRAQDLQLI